MQPAHILDQDRQPQHHTLYHLINKRNVMISRGLLILTVARNSAVNPMLYAAGSLAHSEFSY
jgi:hypothetical protein